MMLTTGLWLLFLFVTLLSLGYFMTYRKRTRNAQDDANQISNLIVSYFGQTDLAVKALTFKPPWDDSFMTLIETPPIDRFRHSNILEGNLIEHVEKVTGKTITKIFWRFSLNINLAKVEGIQPDYSNNLHQISEAKSSTEFELLDEMGNPYIDPAFYEIAEISLKEYESYLPQSKVKDQQVPLFKELRVAQLS